MTPTATTASPLADAASSVGVGWLILAALVALAGYVLACWLWPFAACRWCKGDGKNRSPSGRAWHSCTHCRGTGARVRLGRRLVTAFRRTKKHGTRPTRTARTWKDLQK